MRLIIDVPEDVYTRLFDNGIQDNEIAVDDICEMARSLRLGTPVPDNATMLSVTEWADKCRECGSEHGRKLEHIRAEIAKLRDSEQHGNKVTLYGWDSMKKKVLQIIDKYAKQEQTGHWIRVKDKTEH